MFMSRVFACFSLFLLRACVVFCFFSPRALRALKVAFGDTGPKFASNALRWVG